MGCADDRRRHVGLTQYPRQRELGERQACSRCNGPKRLDGVEHGGCQPRLIDEAIDRIVGGAAVAGEFVRREIFSCEDSLCQWRPDDLRDAAGGAQGYERLFRAAVQQRILRLARNKFFNPGQRQCGAYPVDRPFRKADVANLAGAHRLAQRLHGFFERGVRIVAVALVKIEIVDLQPLQRSLELLEDLGARQAFVGAAHRKIQFRGEHETLALDSRQRLAQYPFCGAQAIYIRRVEESNAKIESTGHARDGGILMRSIGKIEPGAQSDFGYRKLAAAELAISHSYLRAEAYRNTKVAALCVRPWLLSKSRFQATARPLVVRC